jgi:undecaprenyl-diphosphatase
VMLIVFGAVLWWADRLPERLEEGSFGARSAVLMGLAQAAALQPGVSRSGVTMSMGRWLGFRRDAAARISFLMSLPIIAGAGLYKGFDVVSEGGIPPGMGGAFLWGTVASGVTGFIAVWGLLRLIRRTSFLPFVIYRFVVGAGVILLSGVR